MNQLPLVETINYKIGYKIFLMIKNNSNHNHLIIYGVNKIGKTTLIQSIFQTLYPGNLKKLENSDFNLLIHNDYYIFNCKKINNRINFIKYLKSLTNNYDYYNNKIKYIILSHFEGINENLQNSLRVIIEKSSYTSKFIIITNRYNKIIFPILSRCTQLRIPKPNEYEKTIYLKRFFKKNDIVFKNDNLLEDCKKYDIDTIINKHVYTRNNNDLLNHYSEQIYDIIQTKHLTKKKINTIRDISEKIKGLNLSIIDILKNIILFLKQEGRSLKIIKAISSYDILLQPSYRDLIYIESLIIELNIIMNGI